MSHQAARAMILFAVDAHEGVWCTLGWLVAKVMLPMHVVRPLCDELVSRRLMQMSLHEGERCYGVRAGEASEVRR